MTPVDIRKLADIYGAPERGYWSKEHAELLRACADVVEAADTPEQRKLGMVWKLTSALARLEAIKP